VVELSNRVAAGLLVGVVEVLWLGAGPRLPKKKPEVVLPPPLLPPPPNRFDVCVCPLDGCSDDLFGVERAEKAVEDDALVDGWLFCGPG
jgi:hypothetical protein